MKLIRTWLKVAFFFSLSFTNNVFANPPKGLWDSATSLSFQAGGATDIFSFITPSATSVCIGLNFLVYQGSACTTDPRGTATVKACLDNSHAGNAYYISPSELYSLVNVAYSTAPTNIHCVIMRDYTFTSNNVASGALTCTGGSTNTCTWTTTGSTANISMGLGNPCLTVADC